MMRKSTLQISPDVMPEILREVREMLLRAKPDQTQRLLRDIARTAPASQEAAKHDA